MLAKALKTLKDKYMDGHLQTQQQALEHFCNILHAHSAAASNLLKHRTSLRVRQSNEINGRKESSLYA